MWTHVIPPVCHCIIYQFQLLFFLQDRCFSVVYGQKHKTLDLYADSPEECMSWVRGLRFLVKKLSEADLLTQQEVYPFKLEIEN